MGEKKVLDKIADEVSETEEAYNDSLVREALKENQHEDFVEAVESGDTENNSDKSSRKKKNNFKSVDEH